VYERNKGDTPEDAPFASLSQKSEFHDPREEEVAGNADYNEIAQ